MVKRPCILKLKHVSPFALLDADAFVRREYMSSAARGAVILYHVLVLG